MRVALQKLPLDAGQDIYDMLQEIPLDENGYRNGGNGRTLENFPDWLAKCDRISRGEGLESWQVPQTLYVLYVDGIPVGIGKLRTVLTDVLREAGGHAGYAIRPSQRRKGYGKLLLKLLIQEARKAGLDELLVTVHIYNTPSFRTAIANNGIVERESAERYYIWVS